MIIYKNKNKIKTKGKKKNKRNRHRCLGGTTGKETEDILRGKNLHPPIDMWQSDFDS